MDHQKIDQFRAELAKRELGWQPGLIGARESFGFVLTTNAVGDLWVSDDPAQVKAVLDLCVEICGTQLLPADHLRAKRVDTEGTDRPVWWSAYGYKPQTSEEISLAEWLRDHGIEL